MGVSRVALVVAVLSCGTPSPRPKAPTPVAPAPQVPARPEPNVSELELNRRADEIVNAESTRCVLRRVPLYTLREDLHTVTASPAVLRIGLLGAAALPRVEASDRRLVWIEVARHFLNLGDDREARAALTRADQTGGDNQPSAEDLRQADLVRVALGDRPIALYPRYRLEDIPELVRGGYRDEALHVLAKEGRASAEARFRAAYALGDRATMMEMLEAEGEKPSVLYATWLDSAVRTRGDVGEAVREVIAQRRKHGKQWPWDHVHMKSVMQARVYGVAEAVAPLRRELRANKDFHDLMGPALLREAVLLGDAAEVAALREGVENPPLGETLDAILSRPLDEGLAILKRARDAHRDLARLTLWARHVQTGFGRAFEARFAPVVCQ
jgi:hypothetical protein